MQAVHEVKSQSVSLGIRARSTKASCMSESTTDMLVEQLQEVLRFQVLLGYWLAHSRASEQCNKLQPHTVCSITLPTKSTVPLAPR